MLRQYRNAISADVPESNHCPYEEGVGVSKSRVVKAAIPGAVCGRDIADPDEVRDREHASAEEPSPARLKKQVHSWCQYIELFLHGNRPKMSKAARWPFPECRHLPVRIKREQCTPSVHRLTCDPNKAYDH